RPRGNEGFNGDDHAIGKNFLLPGFVIVVDMIRVLVQRAARAMAGQIAYGRETAPAGLVFDGPADQVELGAGARLGYSFAQGPSGAFAQLVDRRRMFSESEGEPRIGEVTILPGRNVQVDEVALADFAAGGNSVGHGLVDADASLAGKSVNGFGGRYGPMLSEVPFGDGVEFEGRDPFLHAFFHQ